MTQTMSCLCKVFIWCRYFDQLLYSTFFFFCGTLVVLITISLYTKVKKFHSLHWRKFGGQIPWAPRPLPSFISWLLIFMFSQMHKFIFLYKPNEWNIYDHLIIIMIYPPTQFSKYNFKIFSPWNRGLKLYLFNCANIEGGGMNYIYVVPYILLVWFVVTY